MPCRPISNSNTVFSFNLNLNSNLCARKRKSHSPMYMNEKKSNLYVNEVRLRLRHSSNLAASRNFRWILVAFFLAGCICSWGWCPHFENCFILPDYHRGLRDRAAVELFQTAAHHALPPQMARSARRRRGTPSGPGTSPASPYLFQSAGRMGDTNKYSVIKVKT